MKKEHIFIDNIEYKECSSCKEIKELNNFSKNKKSWDGLKPYCKECAKIKGKKYRTENREEDLKRKKEWYKNSKEKAKERSNNEIKNNSKKICSKCNKKLDINEFRERANGGFYSVCRNCENKYTKSYRINNRETYKNIHAITKQRRRKKSKLIISNFKNSDWKECKDYFENKCAYCGREMKNLTQDHLIPLSKGGNYTKGNIVPCCRSCNSSKNNKDFITWYRKQKFYSIKRENKILSYISKYANTELTN